MLQAQTSAALPPQFQPQSQSQTSEPQTTPSQGPAAMGTEAFRPNYELGISDQILIHAPDADEINEKPFRIEEDGTITLPLIGVVKASGVTIQQLEDNVKEKLKTYIKNPVISITVVQFRSSPVFFIGDFMRPGIYALQGRHTLVEMLMSVGGLQATAARRIKVTRRDEAGQIPLPGATFDPDTKTSSVEISLAALSQNINPAEDIVLQTNDTITAEKVEQVYVQGAVGKNGGFEIGDKDYLSTLQLLSLAGGLAPDAEPEKARILRPVLNSTRRAEIPLDLTRVLETEGTDYPLLPNDVLYVPRRKPTSQMLGRLGLTATSIIPSLIIYSLLR
jgi:polysaccharide export outer membrane protein